MATCADPLVFRASVAAPCQQPTSGSCALAVSAAAAEHGTECLDLPLSSYNPSLPPFRAYVCGKTATGPLVAQCSGGAAPTTGAAAPAVGTGVRVVTKTSPVNVGLATVAGVSTLAASALGWRVKQDQATRIENESTYSKEGADLAAQSQLEGENADLRAQVVNLQAQVDNHEQALNVAEAEGHSEGVRLTILDKDREMGRLQAQFDGHIAEKDQEITSLRTEFEGLIAEKDQEITSLQAQRVEYDKRVDRRTRKQSKGVGRPREAGMGGELAQARSDGVGYHIAEAYRRARGPASGPFSAHASMSREAAARSARNAGFQHADARFR